MTNTPQGQRPPMVWRLPMRIAQIKRTLYALHGDQVPDTEQGRAHLLVLLQHVMLFRNGWGTAVRHLQLLAPWMSEVQGDEMIRKARASARFFDDQEVAKALSVTYTMRSRLRLRTFGAVDAPTKADRDRLAKERNRAKQRNRDAAKRARKRKDTVAGSSLSDRAKVVFGMIRSGRACWLSAVERELAEGAWRDMTFGVRHMAVSRAVAELVAKGFAKTGKSRFGRREIEVWRVSDDAIIAARRVDRNTENRNTDFCATERRNTSSVSDTYDRNTPFCATEPTPYRNIKTSSEVFRSEFGLGATKPPSITEVAVEPNIIASAGGAPEAPPGPSTGNVSDATGDETVMAEPNPISITDVLSPRARSERARAEAPQPIQLDPTTGQFWPDTEPGPRAEHAADFPVVWPLWTDRARAPAA